MTGVQFDAILLIVGFVAGIFFALTMGWIEGGE
jgi:hypothetical protein